MTKRKLSTTEASALRSLLAETYVATGQAIMETGRADVYARAAAAQRQGTPVPVDTDAVLEDLQRLSALIDDLGARRDDLLRLGKNLYGRDLLARATGRSVTWVRQRLAVDPRLADLRDEYLTRDGARWRVRRDQPLGT